MRAQIQTLKPECAATDAGHDARTANSDQLPVRSKGRAVGDLSQTLQALKAILKHWLLGAPPAISILICLSRLLIRRSIVTTRQQAQSISREFRTDVEGFLTREAVEACVTLGVRERP